MIRRSAAACAVTFLLVVPGPHAESAERLLSCADGPTGTVNVGDCVVEIARDDGQACRARLSDPRGRDFFEGRDAVFSLEEPNGRDINADDAPEIVLRADEPDGAIVYRIATCGEEPRVAEIRTRVGVWFEKAPRGRRLIVLPDDAFVGFPDLEGGAPDELSLPVIRFEFVDGGLRDVGARFDGYYDVEIMRTRRKLTPHKVRDLRLGRLEETERGVIGARVLKIVFSYLYSGREKQAWKELSLAWPPADVKRVKAAIIETRARGSLSLATPAPEPH